MGLFAQIGRSFKQLLKNIFRSKKKKSRKEQEPIKIPESWQKKDLEQNVEASKKTVIISHKTRLPGLKKLNRILAGVMLLLNLVFSQFLLGSIGTGAQPMFIFFILNSYLILRYLWITRKKEGSS